MPFSNRKTYFHLIKPHRPTGRTGIRTIFRLKFGAMENKVYLCRRNTYKGQQIQAERIPLAEGPEFFPFLSTFPVKKKTIQ